MQYFLHFESVRSIVNKNIIYCRKIILQSFKLSLLTGLSELWFLTVWNVPFMLFMIICPSRNLPEIKCCYIFISLNSPRCVNQYLIAIYEIYFNYVSIHVCQSLILINPFFSISSRERAQATTRFLAGNVNIANIGVSHILGNTFYPVYLFLLKYLNLRRFIWFFYNKLCCLWK